MIKFWAQDSPGKGSPKGQNFRSTIQKSVTSQQSHQGLRDNTSDTEEGLVSSSPPRTLRV